jgi:putative redox protein
MELVSPNFKSVVEDLRAKVANTKHPSQTKATVRADAKLLGQQYQEVKIRDFVIAGDEPVPSGGTDRAPTPLDFFVASIGFCENVMFTRHAALQGVEFTGLETSVRGHWDRKGQYEIDGASPHFTDMIVETKVTSTAPVEKIAEVARVTHRTCPMHETIVRAMEVTDKLFVNGKEVPL